MNKKQLTKVLDRFEREIDQVSEYVNEIEHDAQLSKQAQTWAHEAAVIKLVVAVERLILECLITAVNRDSTAIGKTKGVDFPAHLNRSFAEYLIVDSGYFDFKGGYSGIVSKVLEFVPRNHWLHTSVCKLESKRFDQLVYLRNWAAHESGHSKKRALAAVGLKNGGSAGAYLKVQGHMHTYVSDVRRLSDALRTTSV